MDPSSATLVAETVGIDARHALGSGESGIVSAVFDRSLYVAFGERQACIGSPAIGNGPNNVLVGGGFPRLFDRRRHGARVAVGEGRIRLAEDCAIEFADAAVWRPPPPPPWAAERARRGLARLARLLPRDVPLEGLACYARPGGKPASLCARAAEGSIAELAAWTAGRSTGAPTPPGNAVSGLLGLGPGLTPSGDDFLAGTLVALRMAGRDAAARGLWRAIAACGVQSTNAISFMHLKSAAKGRVGENLHLVFGATITDDWKKTGTRLGRLLDLGHSSPWDAIAGFATALRVIAGDGQLGGLAKA